MLAYLFWHRPRPGVEAERYEQAQLSFHRSLARMPPVGLRASACLRVAQLPWLAPDAAGAGGYEDWYLLEDHAALGVLGGAAVGRGHRTSHDRAAQLSGAGAGALYVLVEGVGALPAEGGGAELATWVSRPRGGPSPDLGEMLGDGMDPARASLWRRQLVLGPAPEYCLTAPEPPAGVAPARLPAGWSALALRREPL